MMSWAYRKKGNSGVMNKSKIDKYNILSRYKYPLLALLVGITLMLLPGSKSTNDNASFDKNELLVAQVLSNIKGVGDCVVLISDKGVVVVCEGANSAGTKLEIIRALGSYTGYSSDKITILKMVD